MCEFLYDKIMTSQVRVRIAPSPTGLFHVGTARTALFNWLFAKKNNGVFILRIEDTDKERSKKEYEESIVKALEWLGLDYQEFCRQSERTEIYQKYIRKLLDSGNAFYCYHTQDELEGERKEQMVKNEALRHLCNETRNMKHETKGGIIRFKNPDGKVKFNDLIRGEIEFNADLMGDFSIAKDEKTPLYNLAATIDDYEMRVSHVIRGEDHISNTPKQLLIYQAFGLEPPEFAHLPMILGPDKSKLSKRHGATALLEYRDQGYLPEAMFNFLATLGWSPQTGNQELRIKNQEIMSCEEITKNFSLDSVQKSGAIFNIDKLDWMNGEYIRKMPLDELTKLCLPFLSPPPKAGGREQLDDPAWLQKIVALEQPRLKKLSAIGDNTAFFFDDTLNYDRELLGWRDMSDGELQEVLEKLYDILGGIEKNFVKENLEKILMPIANAMGDRGKLLWPLRVALTGRKASPGPFEVAEILGKQKCLQRVLEAGQ